jgi:uncharacterized membrane protein YsdA (DUF1294 family)
VKRTSHHRRRASIPVFFLTGASLAALVTVLLALHFGVPWPISYLAGINASTFACYGYDKLASRRKYSRVPERTLHLLEFAGGTPGAYLAQRVFHHKTVKGRFRAVFGLIAAVQAGIILWALWYFRR